MPAILRLFKLAQRRLETLQINIKLGSVLLCRWANYRSESEANVRLAEIDLFVRIRSEGLLPALSALVVDGRIK